MPELAQRDLAGRIRCKLIGEHPLFKHFIGNGYENFHDLHCVCLM